LRSSHARAIDELNATLHKPAIAARIKPIRPPPGNELKELAEIIDPCRLSSALGSDDDFAGPVRSRKADYLVTGDKSGLLSLARHAGTRIVSASESPRCGRADIDLTRRLAIPTTLRGSA